MSPLTEEEKQQVANKLFKNTRYKGHLLLPDEEFYVEKYDEKSLEKAAKKVLVWIGVKPTNLSYQVTASDSGYYKSTEKNTICLSRKVARNQYESSAIIARACVEYVLDRNKVECTSEIVEFMLIEFGLGILIINSVNSGPTVQAKLNRIIPITSPYISKEILRHNDVNEFYENLIEFVSANGIDKRELSSHIVPWSLPKEEKHFGKTQNANYVISAKKLQTTNRQKFGLLIFISAFLLLLSSYLLAIQPKKLTPELQAQKDTIAVLSHSYTECLNSYREKEKRLDPNDIITSRQLSSHLSRCKSLQNKHDYMVANYNAAVLAY